MTPTFTPLRNGSIVTVSPVCRLLLLLLFMALATGSAFSQTTWTGNVSTDWNTTGNWSAGVPVASSDVTIPDVTNDPLISSGGAVAKSVTISGGGLLTVQATASLVITGSTSHGLVNAGSVQNSGTIHISYCAGNYGIHNLGTFTNKTGGMITVDNVGDMGIYHKSGVLTNEGTIKIGSTGNVGRFGINIVSTFNNTAGGQITIDRAWAYGISHYSAVADNQGSIAIGASAASSIDRGIDAYQGIFKNNGGMTTIDRCDTGISGFQVGGTFLNSGILKIGALGSVPDLISNDPFTDISFVNNAGGVLQGTGSIPSAFFTSSGGTLSPGYSPGKITFSGDEDFSNGTMAVEVNGTGVAGTAYDQIVVNGAATLGGTLAVTFNFPTPEDGDVVTIIDATALSGTFSSVTGLPEHWNIKYNFPNTGEVSLEYSNAMPVTLVHFSAKRQETAVKLDWKTTEEANNQGFEIQRSTDKGKWENLGFLDGSGTTRVLGSYSFLDINPLPGINYYRLRQMDFDGKFEFSRIVSVRMANAKVVKVYPNPTTGIIHIEGARSDVKVTDMQGRRLMKSIPVNQKLDISALPAGFYILTVTTESGENSISVLKQ